MKKILLLVTVCMTTLAFLAGGAWGYDFCVYTGGAGEHDLQTAMTTAESNGQADTIKVVQGTYNGNFSYSSSQGHSITFLGGYTSGCTGRVIDPANTVLDAEGSGRVLELYNSGGGAVFVEGFTIQSGATTTNGKCGAGIYARSYSSSGTAGDVTIQHTCVTGNTTDGTNAHGGGLYAESYSSSSTAGNVFINNNTVTDNTTSGDNSSGGGIYARSGSYTGTACNVTIEDNTVTGNTVSDGNGGGVSADSYSYSGANTGAITVTDNTISENIIYDGQGGGVYAKSQASAGNAGAILFSGNRIINNTGDTGGGVHTESFSYPGSTGNVTFVNNVIAYNTAPSGNGGGVWARSRSEASAVSVGTVYFTNNTIANNRANGGNGGGLQLEKDENVNNIYNNIIHGNTASGTGDDIDIFLNDGTVYGYNNDYHELNGSWTASGNNIDTDPCLTYPAAGNYHLQPTSPCIDEGNSSAHLLPSTDFEGDARTIGADPDMGADECGTSQWYVDVDRPSSGDGTSWGTAKKTIAEAITAASDGDEIWVKQGTYNLSGSVSVNKDVAIIGGFAGTETKRGQRNWKTKETTVNQTGSYSCLQVWNDAVIDGFSITSGNPSTYGGGIYSYQCAPAIGNCIFSGNSANSGGGIFNDQSSSTIISCKFLDNDVSNNGGGIYNNECTPRIINCIFAGNNADNCGGGVSNKNASATITNCTFSGNSANTGGGIYNDSSSPEIINAILWGDSATQGQEIYNFSGSAPSVTYCDIDQDGYAGTNGNIRENPLFVDAINCNYHLKGNSPCIDKGNSNVLSLIATDFEGDPRIIDGNRNGTATVDMGADEYLPKGTIASIFLLLLN